MHNDCSHSEDEHRQSGPEQSLVFAIFINHFNKTHPLADMLDQICLFNFVEGQSLNGSAPLIE